ncbi:MAG: MBL fold metallo-hydrolase [Tannerellaceae bacterium]
MRLELIDTGYFYADGGAMFGAIPKTAWQRRYPCNEQNGCVLAMRSALIHTDCGRVVLIDNGAGSKQLKQLSYYHFFDPTDLNAALLKRDTKPEEITDIVLTHLHFDHCGYTTQAEETEGLIVPTFPNATCWVSSAQWQNALHPHPLEQGSYFPENMQAVEEAGLLRLIEADTRLCPNLQLRLYDGHTPGQIAVYIETPERTYVFAGDVLPLAASVSPEWISAYDTYPLTSYYEKIRMMEEAALERQALIYCHDAYTPCTTIKKVNEFYRKDQVIAMDKAIVF